jgi:hypothetical protein
MSRHPAACNLSGASELRGDSLGESATLLPSLPPPLLLLRLLLLRLLLPRLLLPRLLLLLLLLLLLQLPLLRLQPVQLLRLPLLLLRLLLFLLLRLLLFLLRSGLLPRKGVLVVLKLPDGCCDPSGTSCQVSRISGETELQGLPLGTGVLILKETT